MKTRTQALLAAFTFLCATTLLPACGGDDEGGGDETPAEETEEGN